MFARLQALLFSASRDRSPAAGGVVSSARAQAYAELRAAESRGDTRSIGTARMKLAQATHDQLSAEVWG
jgi:hypothetical protein